MTLTSPPRDRIEIRRRPMIKHRGRMQQVILVVIFLQLLLLVIVQRRVRDGAESVLELYSPGPEGSLTDAAFFRDSVRRVHSPLKRRHAFRSKVLLTIFFFIFGSLPPPSRS